MKTYIVSARSSGPLLTGTDTGNGRGAGFPLVSVYRTSTVNGFSGVQSEATGAQSQYAGYGTDSRPRQELRRFDMDDVTKNVLVAGARNYGADAPVRGELVTLAREQLHGHCFDETSPKSVRAKIRYLGALFPSMKLYELATTIHSILHNDDVTEGDIRLILEGRKLSDPTEKTREVPLAGIQLAGLMLADGRSLTETANGSGLSVDTVRTIDKFLGISDRYKERLLDAAYDAIREGWAVRKFADTLNISRGHAHRVMVQAREVLHELGEYTNE